MLPDNQRYSGWLWVIMFAIVYRFLREFKIDIIDIFDVLIIKVLNRISSSPQSFPVFHLARAEALGTR